MNFKSKNVWTAEEEAKLQELLRRRKQVYDESSEELRDVIESIMANEIHDDLLDSFIQKADLLCDALSPFTGGLSGGRVERLP